MKIGEKLRYLRTVEGQLRGLGREMTQQQVSEAVEQDSGVRLSQSYLSQIERGLRPHLTNTTRMALARFFKVHPGYLVDDPEGFHEELTSEIRSAEDQLDLWLIAGAERFAADHDVRDALLKVAAHPDSRKCLALLAAIVETPDLVDRMTEALAVVTSDDPARLRIRKSKKGSDPR